jgi:hypothetical protein
MAAGDAEPYHGLMAKRPHATHEEVQAKMAEVRDLAVRVLKEKAKTDPKARAVLKKGQKQGYIPPDA